ncbi:hypothetical protein [Paenibacillus polysaccharolyticus]|uniref:hypothetical protein n=1 Tax=Paenibacillus TaxID=44249 RepID=UPI00203E71D5|nr:hypothetical protein [Paenibacillus polysaccharolyticus]MCM3133117.1 hypothetical protein [Paenibacillus polysaccharolyticus]
MPESIKVEFELSAWGQENTQDGGGSFQKHELLKIRTVSKDITLEQLEAMVKEMIADIKKVYPQPEQLGVKVTLRAKETDGVFTYLG